MLPVRWKLTNHTQIRSRTVIGHCAAVHLREMVESITARGSHSLPLAASLLPNMLRPAIRPLYTLFGSYHNYSTETNYGMEVIEQAPIKASHLDVDHSSRRPFCCCTSFNYQAQAFCKEGRYRWYRPYQCTIMFFRALEQHSRLLKFSRCFASIISAGVVLIPLRRLRSSDLNYIV